MSRNEPPLTAYFVSSLRLGRILVRKPQFEMKYCSGADGEVYWKKIQNLMVNIKKMITSNLSAVGMSKMKGTPFGQR